MPDADFISLEWDERGLVLRLLVDEDITDGTANLRLSDPVEFYRGVRQSCDEWISEMESARRQYQSGVADDPAEQAMLDRIKGGAAAFVCADPEGDWIRDHTLQSWHDAMADAADLTRKREKGE